MCQCNPSIRTPWCGKPGCEEPEQKPAPVKRQTPSVGRIVHYVEPATMKHRAGIISFVSDQPEDESPTTAAGLIYLHVFLLPGDQHFSVNSPCMLVASEYDGTAEKARSWHFPEYVP